MRILFWGTPEFAVPSLQLLVENGHQVVGVVTRPDRPAGRGREFHSTPVKEEALRNGFLILEPEDLTDPVFERIVKETKPDVSVVVAYGKKITESILGMFPLGCVNVHPSLLPLLRGAAPINWALIRGFEESGVTVMHMVEEMDAGPILFQSKEKIRRTDTAYDLEKRLAKSGAEALGKTLVSLEDGSLTGKVQDSSLVTYAPKINRNTARIDWSQQASSISNLIRGTDRLPGAWSVLMDKPIKLFKAIPSVKSIAGVLPGTVLEADSASGLKVATGQGVLEVQEIQPPGKKRMSACSWIRGRGTEVGQRFQ